MFATYGVEMLSAYLKREGHQVEAFLDPRIFNGCVLNIPSLGKYFDEKPAFLRKIEKFKPDIIAFSVIYDYYLWALEFAELVKANFDIPIVFGGIHPTTLPERVLENDCVDYVAIGEGEGVFSELLDALENDKSAEEIPNLGFRRNGNTILNPLRTLISDIDTLPHPDKELFYSSWSRQSAGSYATMASRGCPFRCSYCCHSYLKQLYKGAGKYVRHQSVPYIIEELSQAKEKYHPERIIFHDESLPSNKKWFSEFAPEYKRSIDLPYFAWVSPESIDQERLELLKSSGCKTVQIGVLGAPGTDTVDLSGRMHFKEKIGNALDLLPRAGIYVVADNVVGMPGQTAEELANLSRFYVKHPVDMIFAYWLRYYPKTKVIEKALQADLLNESDVEQIESGKSAISFTKPGPDADPDMRRLVNLIMLSVHIPKKLVDWLLQSKKNLRWMPSFSMYNISFLAPSIKKWLDPKKMRIQLVYSPTSLFLFYIRKIYFRISGKSMDD